MASILNGLFSGRSGLTSHGIAMAVIGDNISNVSTIGYKQSRAEFEDLIAGGQTSGRTVGSGSAVASVSQIFSQGTLEFTNSPLDLAIDGNGFFVVAEGQQTFYTRAGNFKVNESGFIVNQNNLNVLGFPAGGSGSLERLNVNTISQSSIATTTVDLVGNVNASADIFSGVLPGPTDATGLADGNATNSTLTYAQLNAAAEFSTVVEVFDSFGAAHTVTFFFFHTAQNTFQVRAFVNSEDVDSSGTLTGVPRALIPTGGNDPTDGTITMTFDGTGTRTNAPAPGAYDITFSVPWNNGAAASTLNISLDPFTQYASSSNIQSISQDGEGIGTVTNVNIEEDGEIYALLDNGQRALIGSIGLVNFSNPSGLARIGNQLLQQTSESGAPIIGRPLTGTLGSIQDGAVELSTVDIANEFVKLITLQRGFQANSRIITTINQLLNDIINLT